MSAQDKRLEEAALGSLRQTPTSALGANIGARNAAGSSHRFFLSQNSWGELPGRHVANQPHCLPVQRRMDRQASRSEQGQSSGFALEDCALPPRAAARETELLSSVYLDELIHAGGDGAAIRRVLVERLQKAVRSTSTDQLCVDRARGLWRRTRPSSKAHYDDVAVCRDDQQLPGDLAIYTLLDRGLSGALRDGMVQRLLSSALQLADKQLPALRRIKAGSPSDGALQLARRSLQHVWCQVSP